MTTHKPNKHSNRLYIILILTWFQILQPFYTVQAETAGTIIGSSNLPLDINHHFSTQDSEKISILLADETLLRIDQNSDIRVRDVESTTSARTLLELRYGKIWVLNKRGNANIVIKTPQAVIGVRGTELNINHSLEDGTAVTALEGRSQIENERGLLSLSAGEVATIQKNGMPVKVSTLSPEDAVQWTIQIPALIPRELTDSTLTSHISRRAWDLLQKSQLSESLAITTAALMAHPNDGMLHLIHALSSFLSGDSDQALRSSNRATSLLSSTSESWIVHAYILQSRFQLQLAENAAKTALTLSPGHPVASQQLARLQFGSGRTYQAQSTLDKINRSTHHNSTHQSQINTLKGFIALTLLDLNEAHLYFEEAILQDGSQAEPHLGLGLIAAQKGEESTAKKEITTAILLEPRRALLRSYWAKILYQLGRHQQALDVLQIAQNIDPRDPTPHLYQALILGDLNRPAEAIQALHTAVTLNDHKAVYRSRLLLDKDLAVKNVNLATLYKQLGLNGWARIRALAATEEDVTNPSAHLFLANALHQDGVRSWARNSENLLARLMQPANNNTFSSYNNYTTFLEQPNIESSLTLTKGGQQSHQERLIVSGYHPQDHFAWQVGLLNHSTNGWRGTNGESQEGSTGLIKWQPQPSLNVMGVISLTNTEQQGSLSSRYEYDAVDKPNERLTTEIRRLEIGLYQQQSPDTHLLLHTACFNNQFDGLSQIDNTINYLFQQQQPYCQLQGRWIQNSRSQQFTVGAVHLKGSDDNNWSLEPGFLASGQPQVERNATSLFLHNRWILNSKVSIEGDLRLENMNNSNSDLAGAEWGINTINPGIGLSYQIDNQQSVHIAAFKSLTPFLSDRLDPATLASIPIHRNSSPGTITRERSLTWDREWLWGFATTNLFHAEQHTELHYSEDTTRPEHHNSYDQQLKGIRIEAGRLFENHMGLTANYLYQKRRDSSTSSETAQNEHSLELELRWRTPNGYFGGVKEQYRKLNTIAQDSLNEELFATHLDLGYEFRKKKGDITLEIRNLFDSHFNWITDRYNCSGENPERAVSLVLTLNY